MKDVYVLGPDLAVVAEHSDDSRYCCCNCIFHRGDHECLASDLFDADQLPQCDEDGIGPCYFRRATPDELST